jgi:hypothetical protein
MKRPVSSTRKLYLQLGAHFGDFVEKQRATSGALEKTQMLALGASEAAFFATKDFALDQVRRNGTAVHRQKRLFVSVAQRVQGLRHQLLAGAALAADEHRDACARHPRDLLVHPTHRHRAAPQRPKMARLGQLVGHVGHLGLQGGRFHQPRQHALQPQHVDRLDQVVRRPQAQRLHRGLHTRVSGDQHNFAVRHQLFVLEQRHATAIRQLQIDQDQVGLLQRDLAPGLVQGGGHSHRYLLVGHKQFQGHRGIDIVVNDQRMGHRLHPSIWFWANCEAQEGCQTSCVWFEQRCVTVAHIWRCPAATAGSYSGPIGFPTAALRQVFKLRWRRWFLGFGAFQPPPSTQEIAHEKRPLPVELAFHPSGRIGVRPPASPRSRPGRPGTAGNVQQHPKPIPAEHPAARRRGLIKQTPTASRQQHQQDQPPALALARSGSQSLKLVERRWK